MPRIVPNGDGVVLPRSQQLGYEQTLMSGHYVAEELAQVARQVLADRLRVKQELTRKERERISAALWLERTACYRCCSGFCGVITWIVVKIGEDWVFLALLGCIMAILSFVMDLAISYLQTVQRHMYEEGAAIHPAFQYAVWVGFPIILVLFSTYFVQLVAPNAIGSGIPEMKTIMRGVVLKEYLTFRTLVSKVIGLTASLGSGLPMGREGPFVHIASIVATVLNKVMSSAHGIYENESRNNEVLAAACATGVACTYAAPIGGVLFSIEVTSTFFAVRNYWRGFFSAVCSAILFRLFSIYFEGEDTVTALFKTTIPNDYPFDPVELLSFATLGLLSGLIGASFVYFHCKIVELMRRNIKVSNFLQRYRFIYPITITLMITSLTFPMGGGQYMGGGVTFKVALTDLFSNITWSDPSNELLTCDEQLVIQRWSCPNIWVSLTAYMLYLFTMTAIAITLPVPSGMFVPVLALGAALGRIVGEAMYVWFPNGLDEDIAPHVIYPGGYAIVGAAAMAGAVTHTISTSMIILELTGQISLILPCVLAVLIANAVATLLQPSIYDSIIQIKRLPFLPNILPSNSNAYKVCAEDIMLRDVKYISYNTTYDDVRGLLSENLHIRSFPLVDRPSNMILLGSVQRVELIRLLEIHIDVDPPSPEAAQNDTRAPPDRKGKNMLPRRKPSLNTIHTNGRIDKIKDSDEYNHSYFTVASPSHLQSPVKSILKKSCTTSDIRTNGEVPEPVSDDHEIGDSTRTSKKHTPVSFAQLFQNASQEIASSQNGDVEECQLLLGEPQSETAALVRQKKDQEKSVSVQLKWESDRLTETVDFTSCHIDPAPFQLVEKTSLQKVHSIFSLLGLHHAYVTSVGRLVGVVSLKELRQAISGPINEPNRTDSVKSGTNLTALEGSSFEMKHMNHAPKANGGEPQRAVR